MQSRTAIVAAWEAATSERARRKLLDTEAEWRSEPGGLNFELKASEDHKKGGLQTQYGTIMYLIRALFEFLLDNCCRSPDIYGDPPRIRWLRHLCGPGALFEWHCLLSSDIPQSPPRLVPLTCVAALGSPTKKAFWPCAAYSVTTRRHAEVPSRNGHRFSTCTITSVDAPHPMRLLVRCSIGQGSLLLRSQWRRRSSVSGQSVCRAPAAGCDWGWAAGVCSSRLGGGGCCSTASFMATILSVGALVPAPAHLTLTMLCRAAAGHLWPLLAYVCLSYFRLGPIDRAVTAGEYRWSDPRSLVFLGDCVSCASHRILDPQI